VGMIMRLVVTTSQPTEDEVEKRAAALSVSTVK